MIVSMFLYLLSFDGFSIPQATGFVKHFVQIFLLFFCCYLLTKSLLLALAYWLSACVVWLLRTLARFRKAVTLLLPCFCSRVFCIVRIRPKLGAPGPTARQRMYLYCVCIVYYYVVLLVFVYCCYSLIIVVLFFVVCVVVSVIVVCAFACVLVLSVPLSLSRTCTCVSLPLSLLAAAPSYLLTSLY